MKIYFQVSLFSFSSERNTRMSQVVESTKFSILETITQLEDIWQEIGIKEDQKEIRSQTVLKHIQGIYNTIRILVC